MAWEKYTTDELRRVVRHWGWQLERGKLSEADQKTAGSAISTFIQRTQPERET